MDLQFRERPAAEIAAHFGPEKLAEDRRRQAQLIKFGLNPPPGASDFASGRLKIWECLQESTPVGYCTGDSATGEITSLSVNSSHRRNGIGKRLVAMAADSMRAAGAKRIWVSAPADQSLPAYVFYRAIGFQPTGEPATFFLDEILELRDAGTRRLV